MRHFVNAERKKTREANLKMNNNNNKKKLL